MHWCHLNILLLVTKVKQLLLPFLSLRIHSFFHLRFQDRSDYHKRDYSDEPDNNHPWVVELKLILVKIVLLKLRILHEADPNECSFSLVAGYNLVPILKEIRQEKHSLWNDCYAYQKYNSNQDTLYIGCFRFIGEAAKPRQLLNSSTALLWWSLKVNSTFIGKSKCHHTMNAIINHNISK